MDKIREALEYMARKANYAGDEKGERLSDEALALLSSPVASDAREVALVLAHGLFEPSGEVRPVRDAFLKRASAEIERYAADRERKAREEEREACAARAIAHIKNSYEPAVGRSVWTEDTLRSAIKEAGNGNA